MSITASTSKDQPRLTTAETDAGTVRMWSTLKCGNCGRGHTAGDVWVNGSSVILICPRCQCTGLRIY
jgi:hypothetical protein